MQDPSSTVTKFVISSLSQLEIETEIVHDTPSPPMNIVTEHARAPQLKECDARNHNQVPNCHNHVCTCDPGHHKLKVNGREKEHRASDA